MANNYGRTGAEILEERKKRMQRTGEDILRSRGKPIPEAPVSDVQYSAPKTIVPSTVASTNIKKTSGIDKWKSGEAEGLARTSRFFDSVKKTVQDRTGIEKLVSGQEEGKSRTANFLNRFKSVLKKPSVPTREEANANMDQYKSAAAESREQMSTDLKYARDSLKQGRARVAQNIEYISTLAGTELVNKMGSRVEKTLPKSAKNILRPAGEKFSNVRDSVTSILPSDKDLRGKTFEEAAAITLQKRNDEYKRIKDHIFRNVDVDSVSTTGKYMGGLLESFSAMQVYFIPGIGPIMGKALYGLQAAGSYALKAREDEATPEQQLLYGAVGGATEVTLQSLLKIIPGMKKLFNTPVGAPYAKRAAMNLLSEGFEEGITSPITNLAEKYIYNPDKPWFGENGVINPLEIGLDALGGAIMSGMFSALSLPASFRSHQRAENIVNEGNEVTPTEFNALVREYVEDLETVKQTQPELLLLPAPYSKPIKDASTPDVINLSGIVSESNKTRTEKEPVQAVAQRETSDFKVGDRIVDNLGREWTVTGTSDKSLLDIKNDRGTLTKIGRKVAKKITTSHNPVTKENLRKVYEEISKENFEGKGSGFAVSLKEIMKRGNFNEQEFTAFLEDMQKTPTTEYEFGTARDQGLTLKINGQNRSSITFYDDTKVPELTYTEKEEAEIKKFAQTLTDGVIEFWNEEGEKKDQKTIDAKYAEYEQTAKDLVDAINNRNMRELVDRVHSGNPTSTRLFHALTGLSVKNNKEITASIRSLDPVAYDKMRDELDKKRQVEIERVKQEKQKEKDEFEALKKVAYDKIGKIKYSIDGKVDTLKNHVKALFDEGFRIEKTNEYGGVEWVNNKTNKVIDISKYTKEARSFIKQETQNHLDGEIEAESKREQEEYDNVSQSDKDKIDAFLDGKSVSFVEPEPAKTPVEKKLDQDVIDDSKIDMPELVGSRKQISWANDIRARAIMIVDELNKIINKLGDFSKVEKIVKDPLRKTERVRTDFAVKLDTQEQATIKEAIEWTNYVPDKTPDMQGGIDEVRQEQINKLQKMADALSSDIYNQHSASFWIDTHGSKVSFSPQTPVEKKLDELDNKINTIIEAVKNNKKEEGETSAEIQTDEDNSIRAVRSVQSGGSSIDTSKSGEYSDKGRSPEGGIRDQQQDSTRQPIQSIQTSDEQLLSARDVDGSINENEFEGSSRDDTSGVSGTDQDSLHSGVQTGRHKRSDRVRKNLLLNVADDFVAKIYKTKGQYYVAKERKAMNEAILKILDKPVDLITAEDKEILKNYSGKGGLGETGVEILTQYFTDYKTVNFIYEKIKKLGFNMDNIKALDPSTGVGVFMGFAPDGVNFDAIDIDPISAKIASILYPDSNVMNKGFEDHRVNNNYDLIITNVPFSTTRGAGVVKDRPDIKALHDYFLLASLDKAKDNGLIVVITPSSVMDSIDPSIRNKVTKDAELLSAYRLPSSVFEKTGTDVVTDILFFRRKARDSVDYDIIFENNTLFENVSLIGKKDIDYISWNNKISETAQIPLNSYYIQNKKNVLGEKEVKNNRYGQPIISVRGELTDDIMTKVLNDGIEYRATEVVEEGKPKKSSDFIYFDPNDIDVTPIGGLFEKDGKWYRREVHKKLGVVIDKGIELKIKDEYIPVIKDLHKVAALSQSIRIAARKGKGDIKSLTADLKKATNEFIKKHRKIFGEKNFIEVISSDPRYEIVNVLTSNPDIFKTDTLSVKKYEIPLNDTKNLTMLSKHLLYKYGKITIENFAQNYQGGIDRNKAEQILNSSDDFFKLPSFRIVEEFDAFSNVTYKTEEINEVQYLPSTEYLIGDIYKKIDAVKDEIAKGHNEYTKNLKALEKVLPTPKKLDDVTLSIRAKWLDPIVIETFAKDHLGIKINVNFNKISGDYEVKVDKVYGYTGIYKTLNINGTDFAGWIEKYLNNQEFIVSKNGGKDVVASANATKQMRKVDEVFKSYLKANPEVAMPIIDLYNRIFNNWVNKDYEKDKLVIPGAHKNWKFRDNQLEFVNMALTLGSAVNAQRTGAGKTATNAAVNQMLKVTGRANKPVAVVPGKVIKKFVRDITKGSRGLPPIFPDMKILDVTDYSFNKALAMIAFNEWDLILMPDTWFKRIQVTPERESVYIEQMLKDLELSETLRGAEKGSKRSQKDYEKRKQELKAKLAELRNYIKVDSIYFEDLGIDAISLDEAQSVKNLVTSSRGSDLGLSATPSQTALDFNMKAKYVMEKKNGKNIFLYTATPVSNSMLEIYGLLQNIAPQEWTNRNIYTPDDFINSVVDVSQTIGITTSNEVGTVNKVDGFINIDDLRGLFRKYVDYRPFIEGAKIPKVIETNVTVPMNDYQRLYFADVLKRLQEIKSKEPRSFFNPKGADIKDSMLKVLGDASRAAISLSLVNGQIPTLENSPKVAKAIEIIAEIYKETGKNQVVFMDDYGEVNLKENNFHNFIKRELVRKGVHEREIVIVNGKINANVDKKLKIQDDFNDGKYKVIIGTTDSIGAGMDLQENTIAMINIDIPWTPTSIMQRRGRGERPGNINEEIKNINFFTKGSYDAWRAGIVAIKKKWQDQLLEGVNDNETGYLKNQDTDSFNIDDIMSELIEDPKEKSKFLKMAELSTTKSIISELKDSLATAERQINDLNNSIEERQRKIKAYEKEQIEKPDSKLPAMRIEQLTTTINSLNIDLLETAKKRDNIEEQIRLKEMELEKLSGEVKDMETQTETEDLKKIEEKLAYNADPGLNSPFSGNLGFINFNIGKDEAKDRRSYEEKEKYTFADKETEKRWNAAKNVKNGKLQNQLAKLSEIWTEIKAFTTRGAIPYFERGAKYAQLRFNLILFHKQREISTYETLINLKGIVAELDRKAYDLFSRKVALDDMLEEIEAEHDLAFGFTPESVKAELEKINREIADDKNIANSLELREKLWDALKKEYTSVMKGIGFDVGDRFNRKKYYRHAIIEHIQQSRIVKGVGRLRTPTGSGYLKNRQGSLKDYISDYLKAEAEVMTNMKFDIAKGKLIKYIKNSEHNIKQSLKITARNFNKAYLDKLLATEAADEKAPKNSKGEGPIQQSITYYNQRIAIGFSGLSGLAEQGNLWTGDHGEFKDIVNILNPESVDVLGDGYDVSNRIYSYLAILANTEKEGSLQARTVLKYTSLKREYVKQLLGDNYKTWESIIPEGYEMWQPREGNHLYMAYSISDKMAQELLSGLAEQLNITASDLKGVLTKGQPYEQYVLPVEVIQALENLLKIKDEPLTSKFLKGITNSWKQWQLISPRRAFKYNLRNFTGDAEATIMGNPAIVKKILPAINDLYMAYFFNKPMTGDLYKWFSRGGMQSTLQVNEIDDINQLKIFVDLYNNKKTAGDKAVNLFKGYWKNARLATDFREAILRYAAFLYAVEDMKKNDGKPTSYWASLKSEVDALSDIYDKAYMLSNDLLGAYDDISVMGQALRKYAVPFWSWMEVNPKRYFRMIKNIAHDNTFSKKVGEKTLRILGISGVRSLSMLLRIGRFILALLGFSAITQLWNMLFFSDLEEKLPKDVRSRPHVIFGEDAKTGDIIYFSRIGAVSDILDWVGLDTAALDLKEYLDGRLTLKEFVTQMAQSPLNKIVNASYPFHKLSYELLTGRSLFPDIYKQRQIRDKGLHVAQSLGIDREYRAIFGLPQRDGKYIGSIKDAFIYRANPDESAYWNILNEKERFLTQQNKPRGSGFWNDKKSNALYNFKVALRYKDWKAAEKYYFQYKVYGGTDAGVERGLKSMDPFYGLSDVEALQFLTWLPESEMNNLGRAIQYYYDIVSMDEASK